MSEETLGQALGSPQAITFGDRDWPVRALDFNALILIEERLGGLDNIDLANLKTKRILVWSILQSTDENLTEREVGAMLTLDRAQEVTAFIYGVLEASGVIEKASPSPKKGESPKPKVSRKGSGDSPAS